MRKAAFVTAAWVCLTAMSAAADVGQLKYVESSARGIGASSMPPRPLYTRSFAPAPEGCGTVNPKAQVAPLGGATALKVAIDSAQADAEAPDLVRFDFTGKGSFEGKPSLPLKAIGTSRDYKRYQVGPATLRVRRGQTTVPVLVAGGYYERGTSYRYLYLILAAAAQGSCRFGEKVYGVRAIDGNGNLRVSDPVKVTVKDGQIVGAQSGRLDGDMVIIDTSGETFTKRVVEVPCGHRVRIDGKWYQLSVTEDAKITAAEVQVRTGKILIPHDSWSVTLISPEHMLNLSGGRGPIEVPAGRYVATNYREQVGSADQSRPAMLSAGRRALYGAKAAVFDVPAARTTELTIGSPLTASPAVSQQPGVVSFRSQVVDAGGTDVDYITGPKGRRVDPPTVIVLNDKDEQVYKGKMKYG